MHRSALDKGLHARISLLCRFADGAVLPTPWWMSLADAALRPGSIHVLPGRLLPNEILRGAVNVEHSLVHFLKPAGVGAYSEVGYVADAALRTFPCPAVEALVTDADTRHLAGAQTRTMAIAFVAQCCTAT